MKCSRGSCVPPVIKMIVLLVEDMVIYGQYWKLFTVVKCGRVVVEYRRDANGEWTNCGCIFVVGATCVLYLDQVIILLRRMKCSSLPTQSMLLLVS